MRRILIAPVVVALALGGCGGGDLTTTVQGRFPPIHVKNGQAYSKAESQAKAGTYCFYMLASWPDAYSAYDKVTFEVPGPGRDYTCRRPN